MADCCSAPGLMPFEQAKNFLLQSVPVVTESESINIEEGDKRVLSNDIHSPLNVPAHNNSAMDGYALRDDTLTHGVGELNEFELIGSSFAGTPFQGTLKHGQCIRIMTGAVVPSTANTVVMQENITKIDNEIGAKICLCQPAKLNENIRLAGEDINKGQLVFESGYRLKAVDIGLLSSLGFAKVCVFRKLKVAVFSTGDELKFPGQTLDEGDIYESNSQVIVAMLNRMGIEVMNMGIIPDSLDAIKAAFVLADKAADAVISSGGVSVGEADYTKDVLDNLGQVDFWKVAMKPGKPFAYGQLPNSVFFGLPGNPVSAAVTFHQLAKPALQTMSGGRVQKPTQVKAILKDRVKKKPGRMDFQRGTADLNAEGQLEVTPLSAQGSGILSSISRANCYIVLSQESGAKSTGESVLVEMFDDVIG